MKKNFVKVVGIVALVFGIIVGATGVKAEAKEYYTYNTVTYTTANSYSMYDIYEMFSTLFEEEMGDEGLCKSYQSYLGKDFVMVDCVLRNKEDHLVQKCTMKYKPEISSVFIIQTTYQYGEKISEEIGTETYELETLINDYNRIKNK